MVNSPFEYRAEQMGFKILLGAKETAEYVKIPTSGLSTSQRKIDREPDEIVRMLRALRKAMLFLQNQRDISIGLMEKILKVDRPVAERFYAVYLEQSTLISRYPTRWSKMDRGGDLPRQRKNHCQTATGRRLEFAERAKKLRLSYLC